LSPHVHAAHHGACWGGRRGPRHDPVWVRPASIPAWAVDGGKSTRAVDCSILPTDDEFVLRVGSSVQFAQVILRLRVLQEEMRVVELARQGQAEILDEHEFFGFNPRS